MAFPPHAFIIGAQKAGTTSLAFLLGQHPGITVAEPKEPDFLTTNWERGLGWYRTCFARDDAILLDASVGYTMTPLSSADKQINVPKRVHEISPDAKFIYIVRNPTDRFYSAYWHDVRAGREKRTLRESLAADAYYVWPSFYHGQLRLFLEYFPLDRFLIIDFNDLAADENAVASRCAAFLDAEPAKFDFEMGKRRNSAFAYNRAGQLLQSALGKSGLKTLSRAAAATVPERFHDILKRLLRDDVPQLSAGDRELLDRRFGEDAEAFFRLTGVKVLP